MNRDKDHNMKVIVNTRIIAQETKAMCVKYMKDTNKKLDNLCIKFDNKIDKKDELADKIKDVDLNQDKKQIALSAVINKMTTEIEQMKKPFLDYVDMINNEYRHLNMQMGYQRNTLEKQMSENQIIVNKIKHNHFNNNRMGDYINDFNQNMKSNDNDSN